MAISVNGTPSTSSNAVGTTVLTATITIPAAAVAADYYVLAISSGAGVSQSHSVTQTGNTWTNQVAYASDGATNPGGLSIWTKYNNADAGATVTITFNVTAGFAAALVAYSGVDQVTTLDGAIPARQNVTTGGTAPTTPGLTPVTAGTWYIGCLHTRSSALVTATPTLTASSGATVDAQTGTTGATNSNVRMTVGVEHLLWTGGAIATQTWTANATVFSSGDALALRAAVVTPVPPSFRSVPNGAVQRAAYY